MSATVCVLPGQLGAYLIMLQELPLIIGAGFCGITYMTGNIFFALCGGYLFLMSYMLWPIQAYINESRNPYLCPIGSAAYQFPSMEAFYISSIVTMVVCYAIFFKGRPSKLGWGLLFIVFAGVAFVLCFFQFNVWQEVLMSSGIGIVCTLIFMVHMAYMIAPCIPYLEHIPPFSTFGYCDDLGYMARDSEYHATRKRLHKITQYNKDRWSVTV